MQWQDGHREAGNREGRRGPRARDPARLRSQSNGFTGSKEGAHEVCGGKQGSWEGQRTEGSGAAATEREQARCRHHWLLSIKQAKGQSPHLHMPGPRQRPSYLTLPRPEQGQPRNVESPGQGGGSEWGLRPPPQASCQRPETPSCHRKSKSPSPCHRRPGAPATNADTPAGQMLHRAAPH